MSFLSGMLGIIVGFLVVAVIICIVIFIIYKKLTSTITETIGIENLNEIKNAAKNVKNLKDEEYTREKNVSGMTKLLEPEILKDFPEFNKDLLFSTVESVLRKIFNCLESKSIESLQNDTESLIILPKLKEQIEDMKKGDFTEDDVKNAKNGIMSAIKTIDDEQDTEITYFFGQELSNVKLDIEAYMDRISKVNKQDVIEVANKVSVNTIYFLKDNFDK